VLLVLTGLSLGLNGLLFVRCYALHDWWYAWMLPWNLLLAFVPIPLALWVERLALRYRPIPWKLATAVGAWALFFPNAPYLVTDIKHLHGVPPMPLWFDATLLFGFALTGLLAGLVSLYWMHRLGRHFLGAKRADALLAAYLPVAAWGIFLGRELRWNSWDVLFRPHYLVWDALTRGFGLKAFVMTAEFSLLIGFSYLVLLSLIHLHAHQD
jgi:uncharacterized membrane protein